MNDRRQALVFLGCALPFAIPFVLALQGLPDFGTGPKPYRDLVLQTSRELRHTAQTVAAVTFDYRGFDTLGEEFILFAAVTGSLLLMRTQSSEREHPPVDQKPQRRSAETSGAVLAAGALMFPCTLLLALQLVLHGHLTPGGGFQGGVLAASAFYFVYLSAEYRDLAPLVSVQRLEALEVIGACGFAVLAAVPLLLTQPVMLNLLPLGESGALLSAGTIPVYNVSVGLEVAAGFLLLIGAFLRQVIEIGSKEQ